MTRSLKVALAACLVLLAAATAAPATAPVKGAVYKGKVTSGDAKVTLRVSATGKRLKFVLSCFGTEAVKKKGVKIKDGKFEVTQPYFTAKGRFVTRKKAKGSINGTACFLPNDASWRARKT